MTQEKKEMLASVTALVTETKRNMIRAQDALEKAAEACKGTPLEDHLNSQWDALEDLRFDINKQLDRYAKRLEEESQEAAG